MTGIVNEIDRTAKDGSRAMMLAGGLLFFCVSIGLLLTWVGSPKLLALLYPISATVIGFWLYATKPQLYFGFVWWLWLVTPFVRRMIDYLMGHYVSFSIPMFAPYMVTAMVFLDIPRFGKQFKHRTFAPLAFILTGLLYGYLVGIAKVGILGATIGFLDWTAPVALGFHVLVYWHKYPAYRRVLRSALTWGTLILSLYGLYQFVAPPPWDALWMIGSEMNSIGRPEPYQVRVFSMLNAPGPYAMVLMAGLLLLFNRRGPLTVAAGLFGFIGLLLSKVRGAWGGLVLGLGLITMGLQGRQRARLFAILVVVTLLSIPIITLDPIADQVGSRAATLTNVEEEGSFQARIALYRNMTLQALAAPIGYGLGSTSWDSGFISIFYQLGWIGGISYLGGMIWLLWDMWKGRRQVEDSFNVYVTSIAATYFALQLMSLQSMGVKGVVFWTFVCIALAGQLYAKHATGENAVPQDNTYATAQAEH